MALGMMLCLLLRRINYRDWALMGNDSQQSKPPCFWRLQWGIGDTMYVALYGFLVCALDYALTVWLLWSYLMKHSFVCCFSIVISEPWNRQHSWIWQHHPALEWWQEDVQRNRGFLEGQVRSHSHYHLVWHFYLKLLMFSQLYIRVNPP